MLTDFHPTTASPAGSAKSPGPAGRAGAKQGAAVAMVMTLGECRVMGGEAGTRQCSLPGSGLGTVGPSTWQGCLPEGLQSWVVQQCVRQTPASPAVAGPGPWLLWPPGPGL